MFGGEFAKSGGVPLLRFSPLTLLSPRSPRNKMLLSLQQQEIVGGDESEEEEEEDCGYVLQANTFFLLPPSSCYFSEQQPPTLRPDKGGYRHRCPPSPLYSFSSFPLPPPVANTHLRNRKEAGGGGRGPSLPSFLWR